MINKNIEQRTGMSFLLLELRNEKVVIDNYNKSIIKSFIDTISTKIHLRKDELKHFIIKQSSLKIRKHGIRKR